MANLPIGLRPLRRHGGARFPCVRPATHQFQRQLQQASLRCWLLLPEQRLAAEAARYLGVPPLRLLQLRTPRPRRGRRRGRSRPAFGLLRPPPLPRSPASRSCLHVGKAPPATSEIPETARLVVSVRRGLQLQPGRVCTALLGRAACGHVQHAGPRAPAGRRASPAPVRRQSAPTRSVGRALPSAACSSQMGSG